MTWTLDTLPASPAAVASTASEIGYAVPDIRSWRSVGAAPDLTAPEATHFGYPIGRHSASSAASTGAAEAEALIAPRVQSQAVPREHFTALARWQGYVTRVEGQRFSATITDARALHPDEEAEFLIREVPPADRKLLAPGAIFYWVVGYRDTPGGARVNESHIRMQRLPPRSDEDLRDVESWAAQMSEFLSHGDTTPATSR